MWFVNFTNFNLEVRYLKGFYNDLMMAIRLPSLYPISSTMTTSLLKCLRRCPHNDLQLQRIWMIVSSFMLHNLQNLLLVKFILKSKLLILICPVKAPIKMLRSLLDNSRASDNLFKSSNLPSDLLIPITHSMDNNLMVLIGKSAVTDFTSPYWC